MELEFQTNHLDCLRQIKGEAQSQEQTQEVKLSDGMPDIGRVLCAWGQCVVRSKEWQSDSIGVSGGVMAWVLYAPEDGGQIQSVQTWIPMTFRWDIPEGAKDGSLICYPFLRSVDARAVSGRKMILRATAGAFVQALEPYRASYYVPGTMPENVYLKENTYPVCLIREAGEKSFVLDEELVLPQSAPPLDKLIRYSLQPEIEEQKVLGDKTVFRGNTAVHVLYRTADGDAAAWDFEVPFSQYTQLQNEYGSDGQAQIVPMVTSMEMEPMEQGRLRLKAGMSGQYVIYDTQPVPVVEDGYSPDFAVNLRNEQLEIPAVLERQTQRVRAEQTGSFGSSRIADVAFYPGCPHKQMQPDEVSVELTGQFQVLYYDPEDVLQASSANWQDHLMFAVADNATMDITCRKTGNPQATPSEEATVVRGEMMLDTLTLSPLQMTAVAAVSLGEPIQKDPARPSVILQRAGKEDLWSLAKKSGSTVEAIRQANGLLAEPIDGQMLLIPVL